MPGGGVEAEEEPLPGGAQAERLLDVLRGELAGVAEARLADSSAEMPAKRAESGS